MGDHGVKAMGGNLLKTEVLLDTFMKKFYGPAHPVPCYNLACGGPEIIAGKILAATIHSLAFVPTRRQTNGAPLEPAMTTEKRVDVAPLPRLRGGQSERFRFDTAGFT